MKITTEGLVHIKNNPIAPFGIHEVLVGLSLKDTDEPVLKYVGFLADHLSIDKFRFAHVIPAIYLFDRKNGVDSYQFESYELGEETTAKVAAQIEKYISKQKKVEVDFDVREGNPLDELMQSATSCEAGLIVIGKNTKRDHHGILAKNFARKVSSNALMIPDKTKLALSKMLVPFDFSPNSIEALRTAVSIAKCFAKPPVITALNGYELPAIQAYMVRKTLDEMREILIEDRKAAFKSFLENYIPAEDRKLIKTDIIEQTHPGAGNFIMNYAEAHKMHLIVMGAKGHSKVGLLLMGSVTEKVLRLTKSIPVLVVK